MNMNRTRTSRPKDTIKDTVYKPNPSTPKDTPYASEHKPKILPIVLCLDVSPSMTWPADPSKPDGLRRYELQNKAVEKFLRQIATLPKTRNSAEIAFITFADGNVYETGFMPLSSMSFSDNILTETVTVKFVRNNLETSMDLQVPQFETVDDAGTTLCPTLDHAIRKIRDRIKAQSNNQNANHYAPFLVMTTDCDADGNYDTPEGKNSIVQTLKRACSANTNINDMIIPFFIGIGSAAENTDLQDYASAFPMGLINTDESSLKNYSLENVFGAIAKAIANSMNYTGGASGLLKLIAGTIDETLY